MKFYREQGLKNANVLSLWADWNNCIRESAKFSNNFGSLLNIKTDNIIRWSFKWVSVFSEFRCFSSEYSNGNSVEGKVGCWWEKLPRCLRLLQVIFILFNSRVRMWKCICKPKLQKASLYLFEGKKYKLPPTFPGTKRMSASTQMLWLFPVSFCWESWCCYHICLGGIQDKRCNEIDIFKQNFMLNLYKYMRGSLLVIVLVFLFIWAQILIF